MAKINRYQTKEWKELETIQNQHYEAVDILTITGFMDHEQFLAHVADYRERAKNKK